MTVVGLSKLSFATATFFFHVNHIRNNTNNTIVMIVRAMSLVPINIHIFSLDNLTPMVGVHVTIILISGLPLLHPAPPQGK